MEIKETPKKKTKLKNKNKPKKKKQKSKNKENQITVINSLKKNYLSWILLFASIFVISYPNLVIAYATFIILMFAAYFWHAMSHINKYVSIVHHYHHEHNNFFSHFSQMLIELSLGALPLYAYNNGYVFFDPWMVIFFTLFYTTIHNVNYGTFHVNNVHREHHEELFCNLGPDICDVAFGTKSARDMEVENTNHYIPNILVLTILVLFLQYICKNEYVLKNLIYFTTIFYIFVGIFLGVSTAYLTLNSLGYI